MGDATTIVDTYLAMWNETDPTAPRLGSSSKPGWATAATPTRCWRPRATAPSARWWRACRPSSPVTASAGGAASTSITIQLRFAWDLVAPDGAVVVAGIDIGAVAADRPAGRITGFFGEALALAAV